MFYSMGCAETRCGLQIPQAGTSFQSVRGVFFKTLEVEVDIHGKWRDIGKPCLTISEIRATGGERRTWGELDGV